jgi:hypothetical protein
MTIDSIGFGAHLIEGKPVNGFGWLFLPAPFYIKEKVDLEGANGFVRIGHDGPSSNESAITSFGRRVVNAIGTILYDLFSPEPGLVLWQLRRAWETVTDAEHAMAIELVKKRLDGEFLISFAYVEHAPRS